MDSDARREMIRQGTIQQVESKLREEAKAQHPATELVGTRRQEKAGPSRPARRFQSRQTY